MKTRTKAPVIALGLILALATATYAATWAWDGNNNLQVTLMDSSGHASPAGDTPARAIYHVQGLPGTVVQGTSTGAAQANSPTLPAVSAKTNYVSGFTITGGGATAASAITCTLSDGTTTFNFMLEIPGAATTAITPLVVTFPQPIPAAAVNTAWTLTVPSFGSGNTAASANIWGYLK